ncbi:Ctr-domain-containing protein [Hyaloscypha variabilis F]|uniref:Copper transport protein n=1 Tax=Hyaloscypha variabilis (strain UAMH 11265 / GT02V1 / F) TaxID=1149755 RepID=A0A2J6R8U8_HYAVF|nr:Ctr-domain-containing protein [Hyaloscypha variabilis F]
MDISSMTMAMGASSTSAAASAATSAAMSMSMGGDCQISMLWNWYTVDSCFISATWKNTSHGMFAGTCIGVICLVVSLEFLRRLGKEYDRYLVRNYKTFHQPSTSDGESNSQDNKGVSVRTTSVAAVAPFKPNPFQQAIRALLHMLQFAVAYFIMLLAMYYNGYIIISIFIGAYIGSFVFSWEALGGGSNGQTSVANEATVCCG